MNNFKEDLIKRKGKRDQIKINLSRNRRRLKQITKSYDDNLLAQAVIHEVAQSTQKQLEFRLSDIVSMGMSSIFPDPSKLNVAFETKRGKVSADIKFEKDGYLIDPLTGSAGGEIDIAALALRFSVWTLKNPRTRPCIIFDEPLKFLKGEDYPVKGAELIKKISEKLGIQIIMISHDPELIENADKIIEVGMKDNQSFIKEK